MKKIGTRAQGKQEHLSGLETQEASNQNRSEGTNMASKGTSSQGREDNGKYRHIKCWFTKLHKTKTNTEHKKTDRH